jgi:hypothetical protein
MHLNSRKLQQGREQAAMDRDRIKRQKEYEKLSIEKRTEIKKKLNEFRQVSHFYCSSITFVGLTYSSTFYFITLEIERAFIAPKESNDR